MRGIFLMPYPTIMKLSDLYEVFQESTGVTTDTRKHLTGSLFFALSGDNFNGNKFAQDALDKGASKAVVDDPSLKGPDFIIVPDSLETLQRLANFHRLKWPFPVIALTGSNGKTTSKELLVTALSTELQVGYTQGNLNNHVGVPLSLLSIPTSSQVAVIEMGANHQGEIANLSSIVQADHGFITNYGKAHLEGFGGIQGIIEGKSEIYTQLKKDGGKAWIRCDDPIQVERSEGLSRFSYGPCAEADYPVYSVDKDPSVTVSVAYKDEVLKTKLTGAYNFSNLAIAIALSSYLGVSPSSIKKGLENYSPANNRSQLERRGTNLIIRDYYNANPDSMKGALENLASINKEQKVAILGDMFELGDQSALEHQKIATILREYSIDVAILIGKNFKQVELPEALQFSSTKEALDHLQLKPIENSTILLKGSRGMRLEELLPALGY